MKMTPRNFGDNQPSLEEVERLGGAVIVSYSDLFDESKHLSKSIEAAFGDNDEALGIILIKNVPGLQEKRQRLLKLASKLAQLPKSVLQSMEDPVSKYMFGWSHGKETVNGKRDIAKGSFYANPIFDVPTTDTNLIEAYPEYCHPNIWPSNDDLPELRPAFRDLGNCMFQVAKALAVKCDVFLAKHIPDFRPNFLSCMVNETRSTKARLLHYFPRENMGEDSQDSWCGWHLDHSALTVLTSAMYIDESADSLDELCDINDPEAGLYIKNRGGKLVKISIPKDCLALQTGEALEISSRGHLRATPHCVRSVSTKDPKMHSVSRNTLALFIQPDWTQELVPGYPFVKFTSEVLNQHYDIPSVNEAEA